MMDGLEGWTRDGLAAGRSLARSPAATTMMVATLALGLGAHLTLSSFMSLLFWDGLQAPRPEEVFHLRLSDSEVPDGTPTITDWRGLGSSPAPLAHRAAGRILPVSASSGETTLFEWGWMVSGDYFALLGKAPALGRWLGPEDDRPGAPPVAVISDRFWARHFGRSPDVLGRTLVLDARSSFTVVGVAPPGFQAYGLPCALYLPFEHGLSMLRLDPAATPLSLATVRLEAGASPEQARASLAAVIAGLDATSTRPEPRVLSLKPANAYVGDSVVSSRFWLLLGVVVLFLLLASANAANLLLTRFLGRRRELAMLVALGAGRGRLVRRLGVEALAVMGLATLFGLGLGWLGIKSLEDLLRVVPPGFGAWAEEVELVYLDSRTLIFAVGALALSTLVFAVLPVFSALRGSPGQILSAFGGGLGGRTRLGHGLVALQVALGLVLVSGATLLAGSLKQLSRANPGFEIDRLWSASIYQSDPPAVEKTEVRLRRARRLDELVEGLRLLPGVEAVAAVARSPLFGGSYSEQVVLPGAAEPIRLDGNVVGVGYFETLGVPLLEGRFFSSGDQLGTPPVVLVNRRFAETHLPQGALGQMLTVVGGMRSEERGAYQIVGVVADSHFQDVRTPPRPQVIFAAGQRPWNRFSLMIRFVNPAATARAAVVERLTHQGADLALVDLLPVSEVVEKALFEERMNTRVLSTVALLGLLLAVAGTYSVTRHAVGRRGRELALRIALGAGRGDNERLVVQDTGRWLALGLGVGLGGALVLGRFLQSLLFGVSPFEPWVFTAATAVITLAGLAAAWVPARQAAKLDPAGMLKRE